MAMYAMVMVCVLCVDGRGGRFRRAKRCWVSVHTYRYHLPLERYLSLEIQQAKQGVGLGELSLEKAARDSKRRATKNQASTKIIGVL